MYLVVDCETDGLPRDWDSPFTNLSNWPRIVQLAWALYDDRQALLRSASSIVKPEGRGIPAEAVAIHGITAERARADGRPIADVLSELTGVASKATFIIAHNVDFDGRVIAAEYLRLGLQPPFDPRSMICTMAESTEYVGLPGPRGCKWPRLDELHFHLFGESFQGAHDAEADVQACARCFFELLRREVITLR